MEHEQGTVDYTIYYRYVLQRSNNLSFALGLPLTSRDADRASCCNRLLSRRSSSNGHDMTV